MLDSITKYIITLSPGWFYFVLFLSACVENIAPPVPGDTVTVFAAYIVGRSQERLAGVFLSTTAGTIAGFMSLYALGRCLRPEYFIRRDFRFLPAIQFQKAGEWFERYGLWVVLLNRFLSGIRSVISVVSGLYRLPWLQVLTVSGVGCAVWNGLLIWAGYELGANWRLVEGVFGGYNRILLVLAVLLAAAWLIRKKLFSSGT